MISKNSNWHSKASAAPFSALHLVTILITAAVCFISSPAPGQFFDNITEISDNGEPVVQPHLKAVSAQPYPVGGISVIREDLTTSSFLLRLKNHDIASPDAQKPRMQTWMVAGARGRLPSVYVQSAEFVYMVDGKETSSTTVVPEQLRQGFTRINDLGQLRHFWVYSLVVTTGSPGAGNGSWICKDAVVLVDIGAAPTQMSPLAPRFADQNDAAISSMLVNPDIAPEYYSIEHQDPVDSWQTWNTRLLQASSSGNMFKLKVYQGGLYRLSDRDFADKAPDTPITPAYTWRVYKDGAEIPVMADPTSPETAVYLPVPENVQDNLRSEVYWIDTSASAPENAPPPIRFDLTPTPVAAGSASSATTTGSFSIIHREFRDYNPRLKADRENDRWVWTDLSSGVPERLSINMPPYFDPAASPTVTAVVKYGFANFPPVVPNLIVTMSNHLSAQTTLTTQLGSVELQLPSSGLRPGKNEIALQLLYPPEGITKRPVTIQSVETRWVQTVEIPERNSFFFVTDSSGSLKLESTPPPNVAMFVVEGDRVTPLPGAEGRYSIDKPGTQIMVANTQGTRPALDIEQVRDPLDLNTIKSAKSIIVAPPELQPGIPTMVKQHEQRGLDVQVFETNALYDAFAFGKESPTAISAALRYLFFRADGPPPLYLTLVGEASDFRGNPRTAPTGVQFNLVPSSTADSPDAIQGDERYAASIGADLIADFIVGRIPAANLDDLTGYLQKVDQFESGEAGPWTRRTEFAIDDNHEFPDVVQQITARSLSPLAENKLLQQWDFEYVPNLRVQGRKRSWQATDALVKSINQGMAVLNFFGHGGPNLWSHERMFHLSDLPLLQNGSQLPLITCASCDNAWITYPMPPVKASMGELLVLKPDGGAIGLFGPVSGASPYEHSTLVQGLMEAILRVQLRRAGEATFYAKSMYYATTRSSSIPEQYLLLGDPTVQLKMPVVDSLLTAPSEDTRIAPDTVNRVSIGVTPGFTLMSSGTLTLRDASTNKLLHEKGVNPRQAHWALDLPADYQGGHVMALLEWEDEGKSRLAGASARVLPPYADSSGDGILRKSLEGEGFDIRPVPGTQGNGSTLVFEIKAASETLTSGPVQITTLYNGRPMGVPQALDPVTTAAYRSISIGAVPEGETGGEVQIIASRPEAVSVGTFTLPQPAAADLEFVPDTARVYSLSGRLTAGATVMMEAQVRNIGTSLVPRANIQALRSSPTTGTELMSINDSTSEKIDAIAPGQTRTIHFRWEQASIGTYDDIYLSINRNKMSPESNFENNHILMPPFTVEQSGNYTITKFDVSPRFVTMGTPVTLTATMYVDAPTQDRPVTVEIGWERPFDGASTSTREKVRFENGTASLTKELVAPDGFSRLFFSVNADHEIEEPDLSDNTTRTASMMAYELPDFQKAISLSNSLGWGVGYNATTPFEAQIQMSVDPTSHTLYILPELKDVTTGSVTTADLPDDNAWRVLPWVTSVGAPEDPGPISFRVPLTEVQRDVPGKIIGRIMPYSPHPVPLEVKTATQPDWFLPPDRGSNTNLQLMDFGVVPMQDGTISWDMRKASEHPFTLSFVSFYPQALQWDSVPYQVPARLQRKELWFAMDTKQNQWEKVYVEWRNGQWADEQILWEGWNSSEDIWTVPFSAGEFIQFRVIAVPRPGMKPFIENFRITK